MLARALSALIFAFSLAHAVRVFAADAVVVLSDRTGAYAEFSEALGSALEGTSWRVSFVSPESLRGNPKRADLWVTVGSEATRVALAQSAAPPVLAALLPRQTFERLLAESGARGRSGVSAVVLDQPLGRQLEFVRQLLPGRKRVGVLLGPDSRQQAPRLQQAAASFGVMLESEVAQDDGDVVPAANRLFARTEVLLAVPDALIFSRHNVRPILLGSYRFQRPVIAYSAAMSNAGALAALYATPAQIASQVAETLLAGRKTPQIISPDKYTVTYNRQVAQSLGIALPDEAVVMRALDARRQESQ